MVLSDAVRPNADSYGHAVGTIILGSTRLSENTVLNWTFPVVGTGVDPVTSRFSDRLH